MKDSKPKSRDELNRDTQAAAANPRLFLVTGIMAAGKSSVAQRLAERLPKNVHILSFR
jgi:adenylylsulfate kinase-like enzyme